MGTPLGGFGLGDRGDEGFLFVSNRLFPEPDEEKPRSRLGGGGGGPLLPPGPLERVGGGGGGPLLPLLLEELPNRCDEALEFDIFRPMEEGGAGAGVVRVGGGGGGPPRVGPRLEPPPDLTEPPRLGGGGGGPFLVGGGGPARVGGGGGGFDPRLTPPKPGRGNWGAELGPFVVGGDEALLFPNLFPTDGGGRLAPPSPLLKPKRGGQN